MHPWRHARRHAHSQVVGRLECQTLGHHVDVQIGGLKNTDMIQSNSCAHHSVHSDSGHMSQRILPDQYAPQQIRDAHFPLVRHPSDSLAKNGCHGAAADQSSPIVAGKSMVPLPNSVFYCELNSWMS